MKAIQLKCKSCGAYIFFYPGLKIIKCAYCGAPVIVDLDKEIDAVFKDIKIYKPSIDINNFREKVLAFFCDSPDVPDDLIDLFFEEGNYLSFCPFYKFIIDYHADWTADVGYNETRYEYEEQKDPYNPGETKLVKKPVYYTRWTPSNGSIDGRYECFVPASKTLWDEKILPHIVQFAYNLPSILGLRSIISSIENNDSLNESSDKLLIGASWLEFDVDKEDAFSSLVGNWLNTHIEDNCRRMVQGDTYKNFTFSRKYEYKVEKFLIPLWFFSYSYGDKSYRVFVESLNGNVYGERPIIYKRKVWAIVLVLVPILSVIFGIIKGIQSKNNDMLIFSGILLCIGIYAPFFYRGVILHNKKKFPSLSFEQRMATQKTIKTLEYITIISVFFLSLLFLILGFSQDVSNEVTTPTNYVNDTGIQNNIEYSNMAIEFNAANFKNGHILNILVDSESQYFYVVDKGLLNRLKENSEDKVNATRVSGSIKISPGSHKIEILLLNKKEQLIMKRVLNKEVVLGQDIKLIITPDYQNGVIKAVWK